jgi:hypothetical protein
MEYLIPCGQLGYANYNFVSMCKSCVDGIVGVKICC